MSYIYSRALVEASSRANPSGIAASVLSSGNPTPPLFLPSDKTTAFSRLSRFGMTFAPLTGDLGAELLMWSLAVSPAKTYPLQERVQASQESDQACGPTWRASLAKFDPATSSWKTVQLSLLGDSELSSVIWPRSGMTAGGQCWEQPTLERRTSATGFGLWPTPVASDTSSRTKPYAQGGTPLSLAVKWPTPTVCGNYNRKGASATSGDGLATAVRMWPTPNATDNRPRGTQASTLRRMELGKQIGLEASVKLATPNGGSLNPTWVEWLMGWPLGWTDLRPLATAKCPNVQPKPGERLPAMTEEAA